MNTVRVLIVTFLCLGVICSVVAAAECDEKVVPHIRLDSGHPWQPPFGLERVGQPLTVAVELESEQRPMREYWLAGYLNGKEIDRHVLHLTGSQLSGKSPFTGRANFDAYPDELVLFAKCRFKGEPVELARQAIQPPEFEAEAIARPDRVINPVDLGAILVPADWLLLAASQRASVDVAAINRTDDIASAQVTAWFESAAKEKVSTDVKLAKGRRVQLNLRLPVAPANVERDVLHVNITAAAGKELWHKKIQTMLVTKSPRWPEFGATETKLRYDAPISVRDPKTGTFSSVEYANAWAPHLKDVVVSFPNGSRYVFWRGSSYIPFWAGQHNTGMSYEWAETSPPPDGFVDSVEPLMDKELRYGRVEIVESTAARIHVRWSYQSTDFNYKVWGDAPVEDYYFYPDGFGTRVLSLRSAPGAKYEVQEFIILAPQAAFPFNILPPNTVDILFIDGQKREVTFPASGEKGSTPRSFSRPVIGEPRDVPAIYRVRLHKDETAAAVSFNPVDTHLPLHLFAPFYDRGVMVTPFYWGSHWPLARGNTTGWTIDDRIYLTPSHNSIVSWGLENQTPFSSATFQSIDTLGQSKPMTLRRWAWLVGMSDASDKRLLEWAHSFSKPPSLEIKGARFDSDSYVSERRALRLVVEDSTVTITLKPTVRCVNPVFELRAAPKNLAKATLAGRPLTSKDYAWDGRTLWLDANIDDITQLQLEFGTTSSR